MANDNNGISDNSSINKLLFKHGVDNKWKAGCAILLGGIAALGASVYFGLKSCHAPAHCLAASVLFATAGLLALALQERSPIRPRMILMAYLLYMVIQIVLR